MTAPRSWSSRSRILASHSPDQHNELDTLEYAAALLMGAAVVLQVAKMIVWDRFVRRYR